MNPTTPTTSSPAPTPLPSQPKGILSYISQNFDICDTNLSSPINFADCQVILLGEDHTIIQHQEQNSALIKKIWGQFSSLFVEDQDLKAARKEGQLRFIPNEIANQAKSWDQYIDRSEHSTLVASSFQLVRSLLKILKGRFNQEKAEAFFAEVEKAYNALQPKKEQIVPGTLKQKLHALQMGKNKTTTSTSYPSVLKSAIELCLRVLVKREAKLQEMLTKIFPFRDSLMVSCILTEISEGRKPIVITGADHSAAKGTVTQQLTTEEVKYLSLFPKGKETCDMEELIETATFEKKEELLTNKEYEENLFYFFFDLAKEVLNHKLSSLQDPATAE